MYHATTVYKQGKTLADARGDVFRGLEVVEAAAGAGTRSKEHPYALSHSKFIS
jgi:hypothetical protein